MVTRLYSNPPPRADRRTRRLPTHTPTPAPGEGVGACVHPRAGHGVTHFKKNRRAKKARIFSPPFFFSLFPRRKKRRQRREREKGGERRGEARLIRLSTYQVRSKWISREVSRKMFFCFPFLSLSFFLLYLSLFRFLSRVTSFRRFDDETREKEEEEEEDDSLEVESF